MTCCHQNESDNREHYIYCSERPAEWCWCKCGKMSEKGSVFYPGHGIHGHIALLPPGCCCEKCLGQIRLYGLPFWFEMFAGVCDAYLPWMSRVIDRIEDFLINRYTREARKIAQQWEAT